MKSPLGTSSDSADAERQFVWGVRYIDGLILRDRDTNDDGSLDERVYACQDANWNVTCIMNRIGSVQGRYAYSAYGLPVILSSSFTPQAPEFDWETLYSGYRYEAKTSLVHVRHRTLHCTLGAWTHRDPLGLSSGINLYQYCHGSPVVCTDSSGLVPHWIAIVWGIVAVICIACAVSAFTDRVIQSISCYNLNAGPPFNTNGFVTCMSSIWVSTPTIVCCLACIGAALLAGCSTGYISPIVCAVIAFLIFVLL